MRRLPSVELRGAGVRVLVVVCALALSACGGGGGSSRNAPSPSPPVSDAPVGELASALEGLTPASFLETSARALLLRDPDALVELGMDDPDSAPLLSDLSDQYQDVTGQMIEVVLQGLESYDPSSLSPEEELDFSIYRWYLADEIEADRYRMHTYPVTVSVDSLERSTRLLFTDIHPLESAQDAERYLARLRLLDTRIAQIEELLRVRRRSGVIAPRLVLAPAAREIESIGAGDAQATPYYAALRRRLEELSPQLPGTEQILTEAREVITSEVLPAYRSLSGYLSQLLAAAPGAPGVNHLSGGAEYYAYLLRHHTTTNVTASDVHQIGLDELGRIHAEMTTRFAAMGYPTGEPLATSFSRVLGASGVVAPSNVITRFEQLIQETENRLGEAFDTLPVQQVIVLGDALGGFYVPGSIDGSRPGVFYATLSGNQPAYQMRSLVYHETVPGHHLQFALARESNLPLYTSLTDFTSFIEGWALYAERLACDLDWFEEDPYGDLGRLQWEALRASRLVVDTGLHQLGWSFERAVAQLQTDTGFSRGFCEDQVVRYVAMPGQATAYLIGMLKFLELRERVADAEGEAFSLPAFHDLVLSRGDMPLSLLDARVERSLRASGN